MSPEELEAGFAAILDGEASDPAVRDFLERSTPLMTDPGAIAAGARALRARMIPVVAPAGAIDVCGTGGDGAHSLNVSTAVAFVVAGAGVTVAKHGNRAMSSRSGAADVLEALGVQLTGHAPTLEKCLREAQIAFLFAQHHHPAMRHVAQARRDFGRRTIFNLLGPLSNPASVRRQLVGVYAREVARPFAEALERLGADRAVVVHGAGGMDELSFADTGENVAVALSEGHIHARAIETGVFPGARSTPAGALAGGDAASNAEALIALLENRMPNAPYEQAVLLNAAFALEVAEAAAGDAEGWNAALEALRSGRAKKALDALIELSRQSP